MKVIELYNHYKKEALKRNKEETGIKMLFTEILDLQNIVIDGDKEIIEKDYLNLKEKIEMYLYHDMPVQYLLGYTYFYGLKFYCNQSVLIPRFDTEILVEKALEIIDSKTSSNKLSIVDIGCGSGAICVSIKKFANKEISMDAIDISQDALEIAIRNAKCNDVEINFINNDLLNNIDRKYDIIVSNPPYIDQNDFVASDVLKYEPHLALFADDKGMYFYHEIIKQSFHNLKKNGIIIFEIGYNQDKLMEELVLKYYPESEHYLIKDYNNNPRVYIIKTN